MEGQEMPVLTVTGTLGSGARELGQAVAARLDIDFVDQQILVNAARRLGVPVTSVAERDERPQSLSDRLSSILRNFLESSAATGDPLSGMGGLDTLLARSYSEMTADGEAIKGEVRDSDYLKAITTIVREVAAKGNVVILGRGSQVILKDSLGTLHVLAMAPHNICVERHAKREDIPLEKAAKAVQEANRALQAFHSRFLKVEVKDPSLYDLVVNLGRLSLGASASLVVTAAIEKETARP
jgi:cytidylate kinase